MSKQKEYAFVLDFTNNKLAPTNTNKAWILIRKKKAKLLQKYPMVIQLNYEVKIDKETEIICGIDDGSSHVGISLIQKCKTYNKPIFKGTIELRQDIKGLMDVRRGYRRYKRSHKRYRQARFSNRSMSTRKGRVAPSILQKKQSIIRVINQLLRFINIKKFHLEDVTIDIRALTDGKKLYRWQYQKSNRLDENIRKAIILRDGCKCMECGKSNCVLEVHHIVPKRLKGKNNQDNLITLCSNCHDKTKGQEEKFIKYYQLMINGKNIRLDYAQHVMQGKNWLRNELSKLGKLVLTTGGDTANKRIDWNIDKTHSNDALVASDLIINNELCNIKDYIIKPMRRKSKAKTYECLGFKHRDLIKYTKKNGESYIGYITALYSEKKQCNITTLENKILKRYGIKPCKLLWRFNKIYWF
ncbi:RNA-guided endonuclease IscB [Clostridium sp. JN-9]|uniref:RNA-guided endonuclease IscB n=1 Tax=Clostridium sp. JN-9 TaxID=2507159 RepID=UPI000FFE2946|nr:RNA-guided endonuclease IscB [Clostridium sp. JN-9]QAT41350.1 HNH endonuclease [Clostridium sp. JN-9]